MTANTIVATENPGGVPRMPAYFLAHGAGPCFFMEWTHGPLDTWDGLAIWLRSISADAGMVPQAIVVVSAHWEAAPLHINGLHRSGLVYDYGGFPPHTYELCYRAPGSVAIAQRLQVLLGEQDIESVRDDDRGLDHGAFIPLMLAYAEATIPVVQLSLHSSLSPADHIALGRALSPLRDEGVLLLGSGMSYHNRPGLGVGAAQLADQFDVWLTQSVCAHTGAERDLRLRRWLDAPGARQAHPREEHLLPLMVVAGAAGDEPARSTFAEHIAGIPVSCYRFGA